VTVGATGREGAGILVIGIGNPLRADDAFGWVVAERLEADPPGGARILTLHAPGPELSEPIAAARLAIFVDAVVGERPGEVFLRALEPRPVEPSLSHGWDPERILGLAREVYGRAPRAVLVGFGARTFDLGGAPDPTAVEQGIALVRVLAARGEGGPDGMEEDLTRSTS